MVVFYRTSKEKFVLKNFEKTNVKKKNEKVEQDTDITKKPHIREMYGSKPFKCGYCMSSFGRKHDLIRHERPRTGEKPYVCKVCKEGFYRSDALIKHMRFSIRCSLESKNKKIVY